MADTVPAPGTNKVVLDGTHRVRHPEETWELISPRLSRYGITRVADVTGLDVLGIPVVMAVRPLAKTVAVSQGKGHTLPLARVSAAMEGIELWHAEHVRAPVLCSDAPGDALGLPYRVTDLATAPGSLIDESVRFDWVAATTLCTGQSTMVPASAVYLYGPQEEPWRPPGLIENTTGLASGNAWEEAVLHALYEAIERDAVSRQPLDRQPEVVDLGSDVHHAIASLAARIEAGGAQLSLVNVPNRFDIPCYTAYVWSEDFPVITIGYGAHLAPDVAASRAITEAAQSRLAGIVGSRDDLPDIYERVARGATRPVTRLHPTVSWPQCVARSSMFFMDMSDELTHLGAVLHNVLGYEPLVVDLSTEDVFSVVKVVVPGMAMDPDRVDPKGERSVYAQAVAWQRTMPGPDGAGAHDMDRQATTALSKPRTQTS